MENRKQFYITISREFGSGGGDVASLLAGRLGVPCYNKSLSQFTAVRTGIDKDIIANSEDKTTNNYWYSEFLNAGGSLSLFDKIHIGQNKVIKELAESGSAVFVGRCAISALADKENVINIFIQAPLARRKNWVCKHYGVDIKDAEKVIAKNDKARAKYYKTYSLIEWGARKNYHLVVTNQNSLENTVNTILAYLKGCNLGI